MTAPAKLDAFTKQYIATAFWSSNDDDGEPLENNYTIDDLARETLATMIADCEKFQADNSAMIQGRESDAGHDFWLTRNGHGAGFWDGDWKDHGDALTQASKKFAEIDLYIGDNGKIYC